MSSLTARDFASLTRIGKVRRIGQLAAAALSEYDIAVRSVRIHSFATNLLYSVRSDAGERFILRMAYPGWRTVEDLLAEANGVERARPGAHQAEPGLSQPAHHSTDPGERVQVVSEASAPRRFDVRGGRGKGDPVLRKVVAQRELPAVGVPAVGHVQLL